MKSILYGTLFLCVTIIMAIFLSNILNIGFLTTILCMAIGDYFFEKGVKLGEQQEVVQKCKKLNMKDLGFDEDKEDDF